jgi:ribonuclease I
MLKLLTFTLLLLNTLSYSPTNCTVTNYQFTFIHDSKTDSFKVHGLWPEQCAECSQCSYPSCCNILNTIYEYPNDPTNFIPNYWFNTTAKEECIIHDKVILFEHEYYKHISCTTIGISTSSQKPTKYL